MKGGEDNGDNTCRFDGASGAPRVLMHKLVKRSLSPTASVEREREEKEELELSLGLSMNGRFGVDPAMKKIRRSSSVSIVSNVDYAGNGGERKASGVGLGGHALLLRTCSLPSDTRREEGRTRMEKRKNVDGGEGLHGGGDGCSAVKVGHGRLEKRHTQLFPTGVIGSRGLQSQLAEGATQPPTNGGAERGPWVAKTDITLMTKAELEMPYVSTKGYGPNPYKIEGFLYRYKRAVDLRIVCVCHGLFLSPAEFVKHGGGGDVDCPMKHIIINPYPLY